VDFFTENCSENKNIMNPTVQRIRESLKENIDDNTQKSFQRFFKEEVKCHGVKTLTVRKIAK